MTICKKYMKKLVVRFKIYHAKAVVIIISKVE